MTLAFAATHAMNASGGIVQFQPGVRSVWQTHPAGQQLIVTKDVGLTQEWGKPIRQRVSEIKDVLVQLLEARLQRRVGYV